MDGAYETEEEGLNALETDTTGASPQMEDSPPNREEPVSGETAPILDAPIRLMTSIAKLKLDAARNAAMEADAQGEIWRADPMPARAVQEDPSDAVASDETAVTPLFASKLDSFYKEPKQKVAARIGNLRAEIKRAREAEVSLRAENARLLQELADWRRASTQVIRQETKAAELVLASRRNASA